MNSRENKKNKKVINRKREPKESLQHQSTHLVISPAIQSGFHSQSNKLKENSKNLFLYINK